MAKRTCPGCQGPMKTFQAGEVELDRCGFCRGLWFDGGELASVLGRPATPKLDEGETARRCAADAIHLKPAVLGGLRVETCTKCGGVFLDEGELKQLNGGEQIRVAQTAVVAKVAPPPEVSDTQVKDTVMDWLNQLGV